MISILVADIKPIGKIGKNLLKSKNSDELIETIIEKPLQQACKKCKEKNIETVMSSANKKNIVSKWFDFSDILEKSKYTNFQTFSELGKGYCWIMLNYNTLSDENRKILFSLQSKLGQDTICFVKSNYVEVINPIRKFFKLKKIVEIFDDKYAELFKQKQILLMYNNKYPRRSVFIRMPIDSSTTIKEVELYFDKIINYLVRQ